MIPYSTIWYHGVQYDATERPEISPYAQNIHISLRFYRKRGSGAPITGTPGHEAPETPDPPPKKKKKEIYIYIYI